MAQDLNAPEQPEDARSGKKYPRPDEFQPTMLGTAGLIVAVDHSRAKLQGYL
jgi:hypothetical protein